mmetsp:Transcript_21670/g.43482  ORF Transcript_21670/g.43482 Transcript_21670/m.43482 type:complete len:1080 (+) Transcript_21670:120-3359(+)
MSSPRRPLPVIGMRSAALSAPLLLLLLLSPSPTSGQGCTNTCPPLNDLGQPVPSLCPDDLSPSDVLSREHEVCHPKSAQGKITMEQFRGPGHVTVIANVYIGCNAGRREAAVFAHVGQRYFDAHPEVTFINGLKGGSKCGSWPDTYRGDTKSLYPKESKTVIPKEMPLVVNDAIANTLRDDYFTTPFGHPSYVVLDGDLRVRHKFVGPCCGKSSCFDCSNNEAKMLDTMLVEMVDPLLSEFTEAPVGGPTPDTSAPSLAPTSKGECVVSEWSTWSACSLKCRDGADAGVKFRWRTVTDNRKEDDDDGPCPAPMEVVDCTTEDVKKCKDEYRSCVPAFGPNPIVKTTASGLDDPRDVALHPAPGTHLGDFSEGREYFPNAGEEAWVLNGGNHSVSIVAGLGTNKQTTVARRDRGYYHYMIEATALSFNSVHDSDREPERDGFGYWAVCNDNLNTYLDTKEPNYFMGPTLYNSDPANMNTVNRLGDECGPADECFLLHSDMLHEAPGCVGITHDPETQTAYGNVYWAFDATGDKTNGQLVRFDFQQPHGPGSMDHTVAGVRRFPEVKLTRGGPGVHAGMAVRRDAEELLIAVPGENRVVSVGTRSGSYARTAREEFPIFSSRLPSFEYSIHECVDHTIFAVGLDTPSGLALSADGKVVFVAEHYSGKISAFEADSGALLDTVQTEFSSIGGMAVSPVTGTLYFVDRDTNSLNYIKKRQDCPNPYDSRVDPNFKEEKDVAVAALGDAFSLVRDYECVVNPVPANTTLFEQVHNDTGYAANSTHGENNPDAALLASRTDCGLETDLNYDALLLGGYYCHVCLPGSEGKASGGSCDKGGTCSNVAWAGAMCDNHYAVDGHGGRQRRRPSDGDGRGGGRGPEMELRWADGTIVNHAALRLQYGTTYRFDVGVDETVSVYRNKNAKSPIKLPGNMCGCASKGPLLFTPEPKLKLRKNQVVLRSSSGRQLSLKMCVDSPKFTLTVGKQKKTCQDLTKDHCDMKDKKSLKIVRNYCNVLCDNCGNGRLSLRCRDDPDFKFVRTNVNGEKKFLCDNKKLKVSFCKKKDKKKNRMREHCKDKCNFCKIDK